MASQIEKVKNLFFKPSQFFETIIDENRYLPILMYYVIIYLISQVINITFSLPSMIAGLSPFETILSSFINLLWAVAFAYAVPFIASAFNHLGVLIVGGRKGFFNTFKPITYAMVIGVIYSIILTLIMPVLNWISPFDVNALAEGTLALENSPTLHMAVISVILAIWLIHYFYAAVIGVSKFQEVSKLRAFIAVFIVPIAVLFILATIFFFFIYGIIAVLFAMILAIPS